MTKAVLESFPAAADPEAVPVPVLASAFEDAVIGMTLVAPDSRPLRVNRAFCEFLGYTRAELLQRTVLDIVHPDDVETQRRERALLLAGEKDRYRLEKRYLHRDGHVLWADFSCRLVRDAHGRPLHFICQVQDITQRKQAESALHESEARFRSLCALATDWYWEQDDQFRFTRLEANRRTPDWLAERLQRVLGRARWEMPGVWPVRGTWAEHRATLEAHLPFFDFEYFDEASGHCVSVSGEPVYAPGRRFVGYRGTARDVTRSRRLEQNLHEARVLADMAGQIGRLGGWAYETGSSTLTLSEQVCAMLGVAPGYAPTPAEALSWFVEEDRPRVAAVLRECLKGGSPFDIEAQVATGTQRRLWLRVICEAEWDAAGKVRRLHGAMQDITETKQALAALQESQRALAALMSNLPGMAYRCRHEPSWPLEFISAGAMALTGYAPEQLMAGQPHYGELIHPDDRDQVWATVQRGIDERSQFRMTYRIRSAAGTEKWVWEQGCGVFEPDGRLRCIEGFITDITESKLAQLEIAWLNESLEQRVRERTAQLQAANEELEALAYSIAHDLRAPITALDGFSRLLEQNLAGTDPVNARYLGRLRSNVRQMSELTDALLSLARLSGVEPAFRPVDLALLARQAMAQLQELEPQREVQVAIAPQLPAVGDPTLLQCVVSNLVGNAWKFSRPKPQPRIEVGALSQPDGEVVFFVRDNGVGFDMAHAGNLFGAFRRLHTPEEFQGTGIGLALVRKIVLRHGGRVWADARPGEGACFYFTLAPR